MYIAKTLYQGDPEWMVWVTVGESETNEDANSLANDISHRLILDENGLHLFSNEKKIKSFVDSEVYVEKLKSSSEGKLVTDDSDYEHISMPIEEMKKHPGLMRGFGSIGYRVSTQKTS